MSQKLIDIPQDASPEGRLIMQALNQWYCQITENMITRMECMQNQQNCAAVRQIELKEAKITRRNWITITISAASMVIALGGFVVSFILKG